VQTSKAAALQAEQVVDHVGTATAKQLKQAHAFLTKSPVAVQDCLRDRPGAMAIVYSLLLNPDPAIQEQQLAALAPHYEPEFVDRLLTLRPQIEALNPRTYLPLLDLTIPALRTGTLEECNVFFGHVWQLIRADQKVSLFEFVLHFILQQRLEPAFQKPVQPGGDRFKSMDEIWSDCVILLATLATVGHDKPSTASYAFRAGLSRLPGASRQRIPDRLPSYNLQQLAKSLKRLDQATPKLKQAVVDACAHTALTDNMVTQAERELLRATVIALDCPFPPFLEQVN
jgi:hypothetical protein